MDISQLLPEVKSHLTGDLFIEVTEEQVKSFGPLANSIISHLKVKCSIDEAFIFFKTKDQILPSVPFDFFPFTSLFTQAEEIFISGRESPSIDGPATAGKWAWAFPAKVNGQTFAVVILLVNNGESLEGATRNLIDFAIWSVSQTFSNFQKLSSAEWRQNQTFKSGRPRQFMVGNSKKMDRVYSLAKMAANRPINILLHGEEGVGKEELAKEIFNWSKTSRERLTKVCGSLERMYFEDGQYCGLEEGLSLMARGKGTIFIEDVEKLSRRTQSELLKFLEVQKSRLLIERANVRVIAATTIDLEREALNGEFRQDLFYMLNVFPVEIPPLRHRKDDILPLADFFVEKDVKRISTGVIDILLLYHWPGNVRELSHCIKSAAKLAVEGVIRPHHLPPSLQTAESSGTLLKGSLLEKLSLLEKSLILDALKINRGNVTKSARDLDLSERILGLRIKKYQLNPMRFKN